LSKETTVGTSLLLPKGRNVCLKIQFVVRMAFYALSRLQSRLITHLWIKKLGCMPNQCLPRLNGLTGGLVRHGWMRAEIGESQQDSLFFESCRRVTRSAPVSLSFPSLRGTCEPLDLDWQEVVGLLNRNFSPRRHKRAAQQ